MSSPQEKERLVNDGEHPFMFSAVPTCEQFCCACLGIYASCGLAAPYFSLKFHKWHLEHAVIDKYRFNFDAECGEYCGKVVCPIMIFNYLTCYIYTCAGYAQKRAGEWFDSHTIIAGTDIHPYLARSFMPCCSCAACFCPFGEPMRTMVSNYRVNDVTMSYSGSCGEYCKAVGCKFCILNYITCNFWSFCGGLREVGEWVDSKISLHVPQ